MEREMSVLGTQTFQVQKWPSGFTNERDWRKVQKRRPITLANAQAIRDHVTRVDLVGSELWRFGATVRFGGETTEGNIVVCGGDPQYAPNNTHYGPRRNSARDVRSPQRGSSATRSPTACSRSRPTGNVQGRRPCYVVGS
jgi:putative ABC transport system permease protein